LPEFKTARITGFLAWLPLCFSRSAGAERETLSPNIPSLIMRSVLCTLPSILRRYTASGLAVGVRGMKLALDLESAYAC
jgi:hypothetical protein